jgi:hypothetical protein
MVVMTLPSGMYTAPWTFISHDVACSTHCNRRRYCIEIMYLERCACGGGDETQDARDVRDGEIVRARRLGEDAVSEQSVAGRTDTTTPPAPTLDYGIYMYLHDGLSFRIKLWMRVSNLVNQTAFCFVDLRLATLLSGSTERNCQGFWD